MSRLTGLEREQFVWNRFNTNTSICQIRNIGICIKTSKRILRQSSTDTIVRPTQVYFFLFLESVFDRIWILNSFHSFGLLMRCCQASTSTPLASSQPPLSLPGPIRTHPKRSLDVPLSQSQTWKKKHNRNYIKQMRLWNEIVRLSNEIQTVCMSSKIW